MKKHLVEGVVPVLIELKRTLEGLRHWLLGDLLTCIRALLKDHKSEVSKVLSVYAAAVKCHDYSSSLCNTMKKGGSLLLWAHLPATFESSYQSLLYNR